MVGRWLVKSTALVLVKLPRGQICALIQKENWRMMRGLEVESDSRVRAGDCRKLERWFVIIKLGRMLITLVFNAGIY